MQVVFLKNLTILNCAVLNTIEVFIFFLIFYLQQGPPMAISKFGNHLFICPSELVSSAQKYTILCLSRCQSTTYEVSRSFCAICKILFTLHSRPWPPEIAG